MRSRQSIAERAYQLWIDRGRPQGSEIEDWLEAERQLAAMGDAIDDSLDETFPASDPPSSHMPDLPPSNAEDKWSASGGKPRRAATPTLKR